MRRRDYGADDGAWNQSEERDGAQLSRHHCEPERLGGSRRERNARRACGESRLRRRAFQSGGRVRDRATAGERAGEAALRESDVARRPAGSGAGKTFRSEERRVGKECRSRWASELKKKRENMTER